MWCFGLEIATRKHSEQPHRHRHPWLPVTSRWCHTASRQEDEPPGNARENHGASIRCGNAPHHRSIQLIPHTHPATRACRAGSRRRAASNVRLQGAGPGPPAGGSRGPAAAQLSALAAADSPVPACARGPLIPAGETRTPTAGAASRAANASRRPTSSQPWARQRGAPRGGQPCARAWP